MAPKAKNAGDLKKASRKEPSAAVKMACGTCCAPDCLVLRRAMETGSNVSSGEFVSMVCTWSECTVGGQMHKECYDKQEKELLSLLMRSSKTIGQGEMKKAMWTHKYDMVRPQCRCACSKGYFKPVAGEKRGSHVIDGEEGESPLDAGEVRYPNPNPNPNPYPNPNTNPNPNPNPDLTSPSRRSVKRVSRRWRGPAG